MYNNYYYIVRKVEQKPFLTILTGVNSTSVFCFPGIFCESRIICKIHKNSTPQNKSTAQWSKFLETLGCPGVQGWCSGESTRLPPMWPGFDSQTQRHVRVEFVGSLLCSERFFSGYSGFPLSSKTKT